MRIREVCTACGLTKKAIEYYAAQGLVRPAVSENGYRDFSAEDVGRLERISLLRRLDLPVARIRAVLDGDGAAALCAAAAERRREIAAEGERLALLQALSQGGDWASIAAQADALERKQTIQRRLLRTFPGGYGQCLCLHFGRFLDEPVVGPEQQAAFAAVVDFLDRADFSLPPDLQALLDEAAGCWDAAFEQRAFANLNEMVADADAYLERHAESIAAYSQLRQSEAFRASPACTFRRRLRACSARPGMTPFSSRRSSGSARPTAGTARGFRGPTRPFGRGSAIRSAKKRTGSETSCPFCFQSKDAPFRGVPYSMTLMTTPEPTVRPPSRIAKRRPSSMAMGLIRVISMSTLSPGMTISTPSGSLMSPVMSVVRK